jgi:hypothetical protein
MICSDGISIAAEHLVPNRSMPGIHNPGTLAVRRMEVFDPDLGTGPSTLPIFDPLASRDSGSSGTQTLFGAILQIRMSGWSAGCPYGGSNFARESEMPRQYDQLSGGDWLPMTEQLELTEWRRACWTVTSTMMITGPRTEPNLTWPCGDSK